MRLSDGPHRPDRALAALAILTATMVSACNDRARTHEKEDQVDSKARTTRGGTAGQYFTDITRQVGLDFVHDNGADGNLDLPEIIVSGVALFDFDNDADLDIYFTNGNHNLRTGEVSDGPTNRLYRQEPDGRFTDVTARSGLGDCGYGAGVAVGDIDNDGYADVYVTNIGHDQLYRNRGDGTFENITKSAGIRVDGFSSSAAFLDYDRDGYLDLYIARYVQWSPKDCYSDKGTPDYCGPLAFPPARDVLLHNTGDGAFRDVTEHAGISSASAAAGLGVVCEDFNDDGWIDIYVANDAYANNLWVNQHDGRFVDDALVLGAAYNMHGMPEAGMGVVAADFDGDEDYDLFMTHLARETNTLYRNEGPAGGFTDVTGEAGLGWTSVAYTGFGTAAFDLELDGDLDLFVANGRVYLTPPLPNTSLPAPWNRLAEPNLLYLNDGNARFTLAGREGAPLCDQVEITRGVAVGDIDNDGDVDIVVSNVRSRSRIYRNDAPRRGKWLGVRARDPRLKRDALGARVTVTSAGRRVSRTITSGYSYLSSSDPRAHFGLGAMDKIDQVDVKWPDGLHERFRGLQLNRYVELIRGTAEKIDYEPAQTPQTPSLAEKP